MDSKILFAKSDITEIQDDLFEKNRKRVKDAFANRLENSDLCIMNMRKRIEEIQKHIVDELKYINGVKERFINGKLAEEILCDSDNQQRYATEAPMHKHSIRNTLRRTRNG